jgi:hypothetical protein
MGGLYGCQFIRQATKFHDPVVELEKRQEEKHRQLLAAVGQGKPVHVLKDDPPKGSIDLGPITVSDGGSDGTWGVKGTYDRALIALKAKAIGMGADYVQVMAVRPPHYVPRETNAPLRDFAHYGCPDPGRYVYGYEISGNAYKTP